jgi:hypothetical protein
VRPYNYIRYRWYKKADLQGLKVMLSGFDVIDRPMPSSEGDISIYRNERDGIQCKTDNLSAFMYEYKAVLYQRHPAPFTENDLRLRAVILEAYPSVRSSMFSFAVQDEPAFDTV